MQLHFDNTFTDTLPADRNLTNATRQVWNAFYSFVEPRKPSAPSLLHVSGEMAATLGLDPADTEFLQVFSGASTPAGAHPYAMCYGGHQFGSWAGQLGDGRAINIGEISAQGRRWALQLKGAGATPYSRSADGLAVLRSSIREHLCSEAMYHLGVPTTRSLSLALTGDKVLRDMLYDGHPAYEPGAVVCRVAPSFVRFGNFEIFASRQDHDNLRLLADYVLKQFYPEVPDGDYVALHRAIADATLEMILHWQRVGFVHGVMNTDNMSILGLTIDYGPYGWLEGYDPDWTPNTTDAGQKRYRFGHQPNIALWNLYMLANALFPLVGESKPFEESLTAFRDNFPVHHHEMMCTKLGLLHEKVTEKFIESLQTNLQLTETDMTIFFRLLSEVEAETTAPLKLLMPAFYKPEEVDGEIRDKWHHWLTEYQGLTAQAAIRDRAAAMKKVNPKYVLRNYMAQLAIDAATEGDLALLNELHELLRSPYDEQPEKEKWFARRPEWARNKAGCSMLSCSS